MPPGPVMPVNPEPVMTTVVPPALVPPVNTPPSVLVAVDPFSAGRPAAPPVRIPSQDAPAASLAAVAAAASDVAPRASTNDLGAMANSEQSVMEEVRRHIHEGPVKVYIVRQRNNPLAKSEVIALDRDAQASVSPLSSTGQPQNIPTSLEVPKRRTPILEWDAETGLRHQHPLP